MNDAIMSFSFQFNTLNIYHYFYLDLCHILTKLMIYSGCEKDGVHLPQTSGFGQWTIGLSILLVLWTSESSEKKIWCLKCLSGEIEKFLQV